MGRVEGKVAVVTGGGSGIGEASARLLAAEGAAVVVADLVGDRADRVAAAITASGGRALATTTDVSEEADIVAMVEAAVDTFGRLDILHNNAALVDGPAFDADGIVLDLAVASWDRMMAVNLRGPMLGCKHAVPRMIAGGGGSIINMSSSASLAGDFQRTAYGTSKAGLNTFTKFVATQFGRDLVRANAILPGLILTPLADVNMAEGLREALADNVVTPYLGQPDDIAHMVLYLASDESRYVTGQLLSVDGGLMAHSPMYAQRRAGRDCHR